MKQILFENYLFIKNSYPMFKLIQFGDVAKNTKTAGFVKVDAPDNSGVVQTTWRFDSSHPH
jgi:hypothetical protein